MFLEGQLLSSEHAVCIRSRLPRGYSEAISGVSSHPLPPFDKSLAAKATGRRRSEVAAQVPLFPSPSPPSADVGGISCFTPAGPDEITSMRPKASIEVPSSIGTQSGVSSWPFHRPFGSNHLSSSLALLPFYLSFRFEDPDVRVGIGFQRILARSFAMLSP